MALTILALCLVPAGSTIPEVLSFLANSNFGNEGQMIGALDGKRVAANAPLRCLTVNRIQKYIVNSQEWERKRSICGPGCIPCLAGAGIHGFAEKGTIDRVLIGKIQVTQNKRRPAGLDGVQRSQLAVPIRLIVSRKQARYSSAIAPSKGHRKMDSGKL